MSRFRLYEDNARWCSEADYAAIFNVTQRLRPAKVLEFGPGWSTLALIEGGAETIDAYESEFHWAAHWSDKLRVHGRVTLRVYHCADPLSIPPADGERYDLGLVDGPRETHRRPAVIRYCLERCARVLVPLECNEGSTLLTDFCASLSAREKEFWDTGPLAGSWALLTA